MTYTLTPNLDLHKIDYNTERDSWGTLEASDLDAIDAFAGKVALKSLSGTVASIGDLSLALSASYTRFRLHLTNVTSGASQVFIRFGNAVSDPVTAGSYDFARTDLSAKSTGTQTFGVGIGAAGILLTDTLKTQTSDTAEAAFITIEIDTHSQASNGRTSIIWEAGYKNNDASGYRVTTRGSGALLGQAARSTTLKVGGFSTLYTDGIRCSYLLEAVPNLA